jgi:hypothetical protein
VLECLRLSLACGRAGDDGDVMVARLVGPALRLSTGQVACMAANCCFRVMWRFAPPHASVASLELCARAHTLVGAGLVVRRVDLSCEAETCRARRKLVVARVPLVGNWSEMQLTG